MIVLNAVLLVLFVASAVLQYNDPDPYLWVLIYLFGAFVCYRALRYKFDRALYIIGWLCYVPFAVYLFFNEDGVLSWWNEHQAENIAQSMKATKPWIEETREFLGLLMLIASLAVNWYWLNRKQQRARAMK